MGAKHDSLLRDPASARWRSRKTKRSRPRNLKDLTGAHPGELVQVEQVVFDSVKEFCTDRGIQCGTMLRGCPSDDHEIIAVEHMNGDRVEMDRTLAFFVWVRPAK